MSILFSFGEGFGEGFDVAFNTVYDGIFVNLISALEAISSIKSVLKAGDKYKIGALPCCKVNPGPWVRNKTDQFQIGTVSEDALIIQTEVAILIRKSEPGDWFEDITPVLGDVVDAIDADPTLGASCLYAWASAGDPDGIRVSNTLYYGGLIRVTILAEYP